MTQYMATFTAVHKMDVGEEGDELEQHLIPS